MHDQSFENGAFLRNMSTEIIPTLEEAAQIIGGLWGWKQAHFRPAG
jgi:hypothetical protein